MCEVISVSQDDTKGPTMNLTSFISKRGQYTRLVYRRPVKLRAGCTDKVEKYTVAVVRAGVSYANMAAAPENPGPLPWGQWVKGLENYIITHLGKLYVRVAPHTSTSRYYLNGVEVDRETALRDALASERKETEAPVVNINLDYVEEVS